MPGKKGRPVGYRLSIKSKAKISATKTGQKHPEEVKKRIARGVTRFWDNHPAPHLFKSHQKIMCRTRHQNQLSISLLTYWEQQPKEVKLAIGKRLAPYRTACKALAKGVVPI